MCPKLLLSVVLLLGLVYTTNAQDKKCTDDCSCIIKGTVVDAGTKEGIPFASVQVKGKAIGALTNEKGEFEIKNLCEVEYDLLISHVGYKMVTHHHDLYHTHLEVELAADELVLESIVIEDHINGTGINSFTESVLTSKDLSAIKNESLGDVLSNISGVSTLSTGQNVVKPVIHGLHSSRVLIINNDVRHESQEWGREHAPELDPSMVDNISVIKGAASVKYGPNALGGVVIINPPKLELSSHLHGEIAAQAETNGRAGDGNISLQKGWSRLALLGQVASRYQGDLQSPDYNLTNTGRRERSYAGGIRYHQKQFDIVGYYNHFEQKLGILRGSVAANLEDLESAMTSSTPQLTRSFEYDIASPRQEVSHDFFKLESSYYLRNSKLEFQYALQLNKRKEFDVRRGSNIDVPSINLELMTHSAGFQWTHPVVNDWEGSIGAQWSFQDNNNIEGTNTIPFVPNFNNNRIGIYVIESKKFGQNEIEFGIRYDYQTSSVRGRDPYNNIYRDNLTFQSVSGIVGLKKNLTAHSLLRINLGTAWRPPNIAELYSFGKHQFVVEYGLLRYTVENNSIQTNNVQRFDDRGINNEVGTKFIVSYEHKKDRLKYELTPYLNYISNYIYTRPAGITNTVRGAFPYNVYDQTDAIYAGFDGVIEYEHNDMLQSRLSGTALYARDIDNSGYFVGTPANRLVYGFTFTKASWIGDEFTLNFEAIYNFKQFNAPRVISVQEIRSEQENGEPIFDQNDDNFDFMKAPDGYLMINLSADVAIQKFSFGVKVKNLLNIEYRDYTNQLRYFADEPGINMALYARVQL